ncbi:hypothetical protein ACLX1H_011324 [Fusarium chlamydosporum]
MISIPDRMTPLTKRSTMPAKSIRSFHALSLEHNRFAVRPELWTSRHLQIIKCSFKESDRPPVEIEEYHQPNEWLQQEAKRLAEGKREESKKGCVIYLLEDDAKSPLEWVPGTSEFRYGTKRHVVRCLEVFRISEKKDFQQPHPCIGYFNCVMIDRRRRNLFQPPPGPDGRNGPVRRLYIRRLRMIRPDVWFNDPFLVFLLMTLAQDQRARENASSRPVYLVSCLLSII